MVESGPPSRQRHSPAARAPRSGPPGGALLCALGGRALADTISKRLSGPHRPGLHRLALGRAPHSARPAASRRTAGPNPNPGPSPSPNPNPTPSPIPNPNQEADVYFTLKTRDARGKERELGQGFVNLHEMLKANKDVVQQGIRLPGNMGNVGTLAVSVLAVRAARALLDGGAAG